MRLMPRIAALLLALATLGSPRLPAQAPETVLLETGLGTIRIELYPDAAPITVENFLRYVDGGHYDGGQFYRTVRLDNDNGSPKIEVIQGGIGSDDVAPFAPIPHEDTETTGLRHRDGVLSMARNGVGTASSEFFICLGDQPGLDKGQTRNRDGQGFAAFGKVVDGMDVVRRIHASPVAASSYSDYTRGQSIEDPVIITRAYRVP